MKVTPLEISGLKLVELKVFRDERGFFTERFNREAFKQAGLPVDFIQDNHSRSAPGVIRGLHYQLNPSQGKLVGAVRGKIWDVVVDLRENSPTFGKHLGVELSDENGFLLWIPEGFAHGFCVTGSEPADVIYKVDAAYSCSGEGGILWSDPELDIRWPLANKLPIINRKDEVLPAFSEYRKSPKF